jgi:hypothetical protein
MADLFYDIDLSIVLVRNTDIISRSTAGNSPYQPEISQSAAFIPIAYFYCVREYCDYLL